MNSMKNGKSSNNPNIKKTVSKSHNQMTQKVKAIFSIDFSKPLTFQNQMLIMFVILFISCFLFTLVYIFTLIRNGHTVDTPSSAEVSEISQIQESEISQSDESSNILLNSLTEEEKNIIFKDINLVTAEHDEIYQGNLILVNKKYQCHVDGEETVSLFDVKTGSYVITDSTVRLNESIVENLNQMLDDFEKLYGENDIMIACGYRSYANQEELYQEEVESVGEEEAAKWVASPGYSEHQTGLVFDFTLNTDYEVGGIKYNGEGIYQWINQNSYQYGFVLRYLLGKEDITGYSHEPWHFRYVGTAAANYITQNHLTLEEYIETLQKYTMDTPLLINGSNNQRWCTYYVPASNDSSTEITVPANYPYTISGDNYSGFIVTVEID